MAMAGFESMTGDDAIVHAFVRGPGQRAPARKRPTTATAMPPATMPTVIVAATATAASTIRRVPNGAAATMPSVIAMISADRMKSVRIAPWASRALGRDPGEDRDIVENGGDVVEQGQQACTGHGEYFAEGVISANSATDAL